MGSTELKVILIGFTTSVTVFIIFKVAYYLDRRRNREIMAGEPNFIHPIYREFPPMPSISPAASSTVESAFVSPSAPYIPVSGSDSPSETMSISLSHEHINLQMSNYASSSASMAYGPSITFISPQIKEQLKAQLRKEIEEEGKLKGNTSAIRPMDKERRKRKIDAILETRDNPEES